MVSLSFLEIENCDEISIWVGKEADNWVQPARMPIHARFSLQEAREPEDTQVDSRRGKESSRRATGILRPCLWMSGIFETYLELSERL